MCYEESDSANHSLSSGPMFAEDTDDTDNDDELPHMEGAEVQGPGTVVDGLTAAAAAAPDPDAHHMHSDSDKSKCGKDDKDNKVFFFFLCILLCF